jgi:hypothetical protein
VGATFMPAPRFAQRGVPMIANTTFIPYCCA